MTEHVILEIQDLVINTENMIDLEEFLKKLQEKLDGEKDGEIST